MPPTLPARKRLAALDTLFEDADYWTDSGEGYFNVEMADTTHQLPPSVLAMEHPLLHLVLKHMIETTPGESGYGGNIDGYYAYLTRELLLCPPVSLMDVDGNNRMICCITSLYPVDAMGDVLGISATEVSTDVLHINDHDVHVVTSYHKKCVELPRSYLEAQYPGCIERWSLGQSLEVPHDELVSYVFTCHAGEVPPPALMSVVFE